MIKKFVAWLKALFAPAKIEDARVDEYIAKQSQRSTWERHMGKTESRTHVEAEVVRKVKAPPTPPKPLNEQLKGVELPIYAKGKTLPPKAKRQYIKQARSAPARKFSESPTSYGSSQVHHNSGVDPVNAAMYGYSAATILNDDAPAAQPAPVEECRTSHYDAPSYTPSYDSPSSYDGGYSGGSCD